MFNESSLHDKSDVDRTILRAQDCLDPPFSVSFSETLLFSWFFHLLAKISNLQIPFEDLNFLRIKVNRKSREEKVRSKSLVSNFQQQTKIYNNRSS